MQLYAAKIVTSVKRCKTGTITMTNKRRSLCFYRMAPILTTLSDLKSHFGCSKPILTLIHWFRIQSYSNWVIAVDARSVCDSWFFCPHFSERELTFTFAIMLSPVRLSVCLSSVVWNSCAPYLAGWNFRQCFYGIWYLGFPLTADTHRKFYGDRPRGTLPPGELNTRGVVKYSDFESIEGYTSETVQDRR